LAAPREYELVLMLDPGRDSPGRDAVAGEARKQIEAGGTLKHENNWGLRKLAYEIEQRTEADYRWFRFEAPVELLEPLGHNLKIAEGVLRFRIFKVDADAPVIVPPATAAPGPGTSRERPATAAPRAQAESAPAPAEPAVTEAAAPAAVAEPPAAAAAEPPVETAPETSEPPAEAAPTISEPPVDAPPEAAEPPAEGGEDEAGPPVE
jgi:small subunit ribosomal protein S6